MGKASRAKRTGSGQAAAAPEPAKGSASAASTKPVRPLR